MVFHSANPQTALLEQRYKLFDQCGLAGVRAPDDRYDWW
jgi:hypothetical protein